MKQYLFVVILTATITLVLAWAVWQLSMRYKLYPGIRERDVHKTPTPRLGGVAMYLGIVAAFLASSQHPFFSIFWADPAAVWAILGATTLIVLVGVADDIWDLDWMIKLGAQFAAAGIIAWFGKLQILSLIFLLELSTESKKPHYMRGGVPGKIDSLPFDGISGIWAPKIKFWDPLGFTGALTEEQKAKKRKAELKNGRLAMIGIISFLVGHNLPGAVPALNSAF